MMASVHPCLSAAPSFLPAGTAVAQHLVSVYPRQSVHSTFLVAGCVWNLVPHLAREALLPFAPCSPCALSLHPLHSLCLQHFGQLAGGPASEALSLNTYKKCIGGVRRQV